MAKAINTTARNFLLLNGTTIPLKALTGGVISAEVVQETTDQAMIANKHLGATIYEDFIVETGLHDEISKSMKKTWNGGNVRLNGSFITADINSKASFEDVFMDSLLTETTIPQCDAASKEVAFFRLRLKPALIRNQKGDGRVIGSPAGTRQKQMLASNFKFELGSLPCSRVASIDSFTVKLNVGNESQSNNRYVNMTTKSINFPNLFLTISAADLDPWLEWHKQFVVDRNNRTEELNGRLVFLEPNLKGELFAISFQGVGIFSLQRNWESVNTVSRFRVGLYCERMQIEN